MSEARPVTISIAQVSLRATPQRHTQDPDHQVGADCDRAGLRVPDGRNWSEPHKLAKIEMGDYQISWRTGARVATAFDYHPKPIGLNARANLYYLESSDFGRTWRNSTGQPVATPVTNVASAALVYDSRKDGLLVYLKHLNFDAQGHPVIMFLTSRGFEPGPENGPRQWKTARWTGKEWIILSRGNRERAWRDSKTEALAGAAAGHQT